MLWHVTSTYGTDLAYGQSTFMCQLLSAKVIMKKCFQKEPTKYIKFLFTNIYLPDFSVRHFLQHHILHLTEGRKILYQKVPPCIMLRPVSVNQNASITNFINMCFGLYNCLQKSKCYGDILSQTEPIKTYGHWNKLSDATDQMIRW